MTPQELKSSILQLAIQGKLVEQRPEEGTGEELYRQIQKEKQELIKAGIIKKEKPLPEISEDEIPFEIPESWMWIRLGELVRVIGGTSYNKGDVSQKGIRILRGGNIQTMKVLLGDDDVFLPFEYNDNEKQVQVGDILIVASTGSKTVIGKAGYVDRELPNTMIGAFLRICRPIFFPTVDYLRCIFDTELYRKHIRNLSQGTNINNVKESYITEFVIPLPPLAEQHRIVAKIEELLPYIDRYEKAWSRLEEFNKRFPVDMQKSILQMAIQGKLVEQRPEEGTGEELFQQIQAEKQKLIKEGKIKKEKPLPEISENDIPFDIPVSWKWAYLLDIIEERPVNGYSPKGVDYVTEIRNLTLTATTSGRFKADAFKYVDIPQSDAAKYWLKKGDLLVQRSNSRELVGTSCIYTGTDNAFIYPDLMMRMRVMNGIYVKYIDYVLKSPMVRSYYMVSASGTSESMPKINQKTVSLTPIPLPPLAEQKRIVAKLEEILPFCEKLKSK